MSTNEEFAEEQFEAVEETEELVQEESYSKEDKFLGIKNTVVAEDSTEEFDVEIIDDRPEADRKTPRSDEQKETDQAEIEQEKQNAITKKASGKQKLKNLGLDDDEIKALIGA